MLDRIFKRNKEGRKGIYIAEIGLNHNGDYAVAANMIRAAHKAGADAVKFQTFVPENMNSIYTTSLLEQGVEENPGTGLVEFFRQFVFSIEEYRDLQAQAQELGLVFFSTPFDRESLELLEELAVPLYKIASSELTNLPLIKQIAGTGKPALLSTGMAREEEIGLAIELFEKESNADIILMHCVSLYPPEPAEVNLGRISALKERFNREVGYSDHAPEHDASLLAASLGVRIFEKHFTIDRGYECPDMVVSLSPGAFADMIGSIEKAISMMGDGSISYKGKEADTAQAARRSLFAKRFIPGGTIIEAEDLAALRPGTGIPVYEIDTIIGKESRVDIKKDFLIRKEFFE
ncbi:MAG: N-acetylneuraminate synthase [bacterium]|nr:N-acetylneuraminate synthase [bacterium]